MREDRTVPEVGEPRGSSGEERSFADRLMDLLVFAPAGALLTAMEDFPQLATKGRSRLETELRNAQVVGQFAVAQGQRVLRARLERLVVDRHGAGAPPAPEAPDGAGPRTTVPAAPRQKAAPAAPDVPSRPPVVPRTGRPAPRRPAAGPQVPAPPGRPSPAAEGGGAGDLGIPEYDMLSASQVVRRLDGLGAAELRAVVGHESRTRRRRTILNRAQQLLAADGALPPPDR